MKNILSISIFLSLFFQSCTAWPLLTGTLGLAVGKKGDSVSLLPLFLRSSDPVITRIELSSQDTSIARGMSAAFQVTAIYDNGTNSDITSSASVISEVQSVATIQENRVRGISPGFSLLQVEYNGLYTQLKIEVTPAVLNSIQVDSLVSGPLPKGSNRQFSAIGIFSDGSHQDISNDPLTIWSTNDSSLARVNASGAVSGINLGIAHIHASFGSKQGSSSLTVSAATLSSIQVTPADPNLPLGKNQQLTATGIYSDNSNRDISASVVWNISDHTIASIQPQGLLETINVGPVVVSASFGSKVGSTKLTVTPASLVSISVSPVNSSAAKGLNQPFIATGIFSDNSNSDITDQVTWTSSDTNILVVSNASGSHGLASAVNQGAVTVTASVGGIEGFTDFSVTPATLVSISVTPVLPSKAKGLTEQFTATGTFTDHSKRDITSSVTWASSSGAASVSNVSGNEGLGKTLSIGDTTVTATLGRVSGNTTLTVTPAILTSIQIGPINPSLAKGLRKKFSATGIYSDHSNSDITSSVTWFSSDSSVSAISNAVDSKGVASGNTIGTTNIKATLGNIGSAISTLSVTAAELVSIGITPSSSSKAKGLKENFKATGVFTDNSTQDLTEHVTWSSSDTAVAEIVNAVGNKGVANSLAAGSSDVSAALGSITSPSVAFTVTPAQLVSIAVTPNGASVAKGLKQRFQATGTYTDHSTQDVTNLVSWSSSNPGKAAVSSAANSEGLTTAISAGNTNITATLGAISGSSALNVTSAILTSIEVTPSLSSVAKGLTKRFAATGIYSDNSTQDLTSVATWVSSDPSKVAIENEAGQKGIAFASTLGNSNITAFYNSIRSAPTPMEVTAAELERIVITPDLTSKAKGLSQQFVAEGLFTDNSRQDLTDLATWYSSDSKIAPVGNADGKKGLVKALSEGTRIFRRFIIPSTVNRSALT
ncbi:bacterial Ig-like domain, group 2 [Leptospira alstonii serovar Pingchang str. 80-412]|uniref:Bacterial Ig-like domain, group 2 n=2 Tax=Leptospira alstonii TaxID=28452 RepID=M6CVW3_9LEPT|nr:bacterial Ig-like domain, group 2 [Leptospira alstonii serovar Sichuan str. 79601]EQA81221.1 bacterial Ig-like domain, group 2 [Leptospira alstonii serovar Pingchang str. 80-412]